MSSAVATPEVLVKPRMDCGHYRVAGKIRQSRAGQFRIILQDQTVSPIDFILVGGDPLEKLRFLNTNIVANVFVPQKITSNNRSFVMLESFDFEKDPYSSPLIAKISSAACRRHR